MWPVAARSLPCHNLFTIRHARASTATDGKKVPGSKTFEASEFKAKKLKLPFGRHRDKIRILGDIVSPMPADWLAKPRGDRDELL